MARKWQLKTWVTLAAVLGAAAGGALAGQANKKLLIEGSTTVGPIADAFKEYFEKAKGWNIEVNKTGSGDGAAALVDGRCDIADMSRFMKPDEFKKAVDKGVMPVAHVVALDAVCVIVHPNNPVKDLTLDQIRKIYTGQISNWKEVGGPDQAIVVVSRDNSSGTYETFQHFVMTKSEMGKKVEYANSNPQAQQRVQSTEAAIGYVGLAFQKGVKTLLVNGVAPDRKLILSGKYPISRPLFMFTNGYPALGSMAHVFVTFHLTEKGQDIINAKGFVAVTDY